MQIGDLDLDGRPDVVARDQSAFGKSGNAIHLYRQDRPNSWRRRTIACPHGEGLKLGDIDIVGANHSGKSHPLEIWRNELHRP